MNLTTISAPPFEPITLAELYKALRLDTEGSPATHFDDTRLTTLIASARESVEKLSKRSLVRRTLRAAYQGFPISRDAYTATTAAARMESRVGGLPLYAPPVSSITSVSYYDSDNVLTAVDPASYYLTDDLLPQVRFVTGFSAPTAYNRPDAVRVVYVAGYEPAGSPPSTQEDYAANIPAPLKQACILSVQLNYDDLLPADSDRVMKAIEYLVAPFRVHALA